MFLQLKIGLNDQNVPGLRLTRARNMISGNWQFLDPKVAKPVNEASTGATAD